MQRGQSHEATSRLDQANGRVRSVHPGDAGHGRGSEYLALSVAAVAVLRACADEDLEMNGLRFDLGEIAILVIARGPESSAALNTQCDVCAVGPFREDQIVQLSDRWGIVGCQCDYLINACSGIICVMDWQLRKIDPPAEPESLTMREEVEA
jgi:hypothetical protein